MPYALSGSTRVLLAGLLAIALLIQVGYSTTHVIGQSYAHNGRISLAQKNGDDAAWFFRQANDWVPYNHHWWYSLAISEQNRGNTDPAIDALKQCLEKAPMYIPGLNRASGIMIETGNQAIAGSLAERAERLVPNYWESTYLRGLSFLTSGDRENALRYLFVADQQSLDPDPRVLGFLAQAAFELDRSELAANAIDRAVAADAGIGRHWMLSGDIHGARKEMEKARVAYDRAIPLYASTEPGLSYELATIHTRLGELYVIQKDPDRAIQSFHDAAGYYADLVSYRGSLKKIHTGLMPTFQSKPVERLMEWACVLSAGHLWEEAIAIFEGFDSGAESWTSLGRYSYGMALRKSGEPKRALAQFRALPSLGLIPAMAYAETLYEAGQPAAARFEYAKIPTVFQLSESEREAVQLRIEALSQPQ